MTRIVVGPSLRARLEARLELVEHRIANLRQELWDAEQIVEPAELVHPRRTAAKRAELRSLWMQRAQITRALR